MTASPALGQIRWARWGRERFEDIVARRSKPDARGRVAKGPALASRSESGTPEGILENVGGCKPPSIRKTPLRSEASASLRACMADKMESIARRSDATALV